MPSREVPIVDDGNAARRLSLPASIVARRVLPASTLNAGVE